MTFAGKLASLGHRPQNIPNRNAVALTEFMLHMQ